MDAGSSSEGGGVLDAGRSSRLLEKAAVSEEGGGVLEAGQSSPEGRKACWRGGRAVSRRRPEGDGTESAACGSRPWNGRQAALSYLRMCNDHIPPR